MTEDEAATRAALRRYQEHGSDLTRPMAMDFFVAVPDRKAGEKVAAEAERLGFDTSVEMDDESQEWTCYCSKTIVPALATVLAIEKQLDEIGQRHGGHADGFGSFGNAVN